MTLTDAPSEIMDRIRKLLTMGQRADHGGSAAQVEASENEASAAMQKAHNLLLKYNLEMGEVMAREAASANPTASVEHERITTGIPGKTTTYLWMRDVANVVAKHNFCESISGGGKKVKGVIEPYYVILIGRRQNIAAAREMTQWLIPYLWRLSLEAVPRHGSGASKFSWQVAFCQGARARIERRFKEQREGEAAQTMALVPIIAQVNRQYMRDNFQHVSTHMRTIRIDRGAWNAGYEKGGSIGLTAPSRGLRGPSTGLARS